MRKLILMLALGAFMMSANAQIATENSKLFDNWSVGANVGVTTPFDLNSMFPLNTTIGVNVRKDITPIIGLQLEYTAFLNDNHFGDIKTAVNASNIGLNGVINWSNLAFGYKGSPRLFELSSVTGVGWLHKYDVSCNHLTAKTGLDLAWNLGKGRYHSIVLSPSIYWNLNKYGDIQFDRRGAQLAVSVGYVYRFKNSNGTHAFKIYDVGAMESEISRLNEELAKKPKVIKKVIRVEGKSETVTTVTTQTDKWVAQFAQGSSELSANAKELLLTIPKGAEVNVVGIASPEGSEARNLKLSTSRAEVVANFLTENGIIVKSVEGKGVVEGSTTNRLAIVTLAE